MWLHLLIGIVIGITLFVVLANFVRSEKSVRHSVESPYGIDDPQFVRSMGSLLGPMLVEGNRVTELRNGDEIFPAMVSAIRDAKRTVTFETFIYWSGEVGRDFAEALSERARAGVKVLILLDWAGSVRMDTSLLRQMKDAGCQVERYHAPRWYHLARMNNRTHRKLLVIDGKVGFTGGVGIADKWSGHAQDREHWRDTHFRVEGPVVAQMQAVFMVNWIRARGQVEHTTDFFPPLAAVGTQAAQMFHSSPDEGSENIRIMYLLSLAAVRRRLLLEQAYFVPDNLVVQKLVDAAKRGVEIEIIVPGANTDSPTVGRAGRARWGPLLAAGIKLYVYEPTNLHTKIMVADDCWSSVGSTNFDNRSFRLNDEANLNVLDRGLAAELTRSFESDRAKSRRVTLAEWRGRPWYTQLIDRACALFRHQM